MRRSEHKVFLESGIAAAISEFTQQLFLWLAKPIEVHHTVERKPPPKPRRATMVIRDNEGYSWYSPQLDLSYRSSIPVYVPLSKVTGKPDDAAKQFMIGLELHYD